MMGKPFISIVLDIHFKPNVQLTSALNLHFTHHLLCHYFVRGLEESGFLCETLHASCP